MKRYLPAFLELPFEGQPGTESLLAAIAMARQFHRGELREIPASAIEFATGAWRASLLKAFDRRLWRTGPRRVIRSGRVTRTELVYPWNQQVTEVR